jgi:hypothetical protein
MEGRSALDVEPLSVSVLEAIDLSKKAIQRYHFSKVKAPHQRPAWSKQGK